MEKPTPTSRNLKRQIEREQAKAVIKDTVKNAVKVKRLTAELAKYFGTYTQAMKESLAVNTRGSIKSIQFNYEMNAQAITYDEIKHSIDPESAKDPMWEKARRPEQPELVNIMYFRIEKVITLKPGEEAEARPGIPEQVRDLQDYDVDGNISKCKQITQLFYHALQPLISTSEYDSNAAQCKILEDFNMHVMCLGIDFQSMNNNNTWNKILQEQASNIDNKVQQMSEEVDEIFNNAMHVTK